MSEEWIVTEYVRKRYIIVEEKARNRICELDRDMTYTAWWKDGI